MLANKKLIVVHQSMFSVSCLFPFYWHRRNSFGEILRYRQNDPIVGFSALEFLCPNEIKYFLALETLDWMGCHHHSLAVHVCDHDATAPVSTIEMKWANFDGFSCKRFSKWINPNKSISPCSARVSTTCFQHQFVNLTPTTRPWFPDTLDFQHINLCELFGLPDVSFCY